MTADDAAAAGAADTAGANTGDAEAGDAASAPLSKAAVGAAGWVRGFCGGDAAAVTAVIENLGSWGARIVLVAADGNYGDVVVRSLDEAQQVCLRAGVTVGEWDRETAARVGVSGADRRKMAGTGR